MHGRRGGEEGKHMRSGEVKGSRAPVNCLSEFSESEKLSQTGSGLSLSDSFVKDGRTIRVGDCALFQAGNAPPFIGIIRCFTIDKDDGVKICVNWLYRPADVKLAKGILLDSAPNEVFYSFHKDLISAASLLHPCKVAFLRKGVELPSGISSLVCRRVYDIDNKCLWWLTDQDYINERQEEVDRLLNRTPLEMHAAVPSGGRSPKPLNGPTNSQQLKSSSESVQNSGTSSASQSKSRKRDRSDQGSEPLKRERFGKPDDGDSSYLKFESMIKGEIAKIRERGGLMSTESAEKLVNLMQLDRTERKIDVSGRILIAEVIASTDRCSDCLSRILQLRALPILDSWIQEAHKRRTGSDGSSPKENDKATEELLLSLLRALDKLPVDLHALQSCNIGKSVNHLRSHKNGEIHKKAKSLVDTWKKRVDAEMTKINDAKSVGSNQPASSPAKASFPDGFQAGNRRGGTTDESGKGPVTQPSACKTMAGKTAGPKDQLSKVAVTGGSLEMPLLLKEEKSSSSSQSLNNSQSCSSDHGKAVGSSWKEDARSSTAGSLNGVKGHGSSSRKRRPSNGLSGASPGVLKEGNQGNMSSLSQASTLEKASQSGLTRERSLDMSAADQGNNNKFIVKFPNPGRIPASNISGGSLDDPSVTGNRVSSPGIVDRHEHSDRRMKTRSDACQSHIGAEANAEPCQSSEIKEGFPGADGLKPPATILDDKYNKTVEDSAKPRNASRYSFLSSGKEKSVLSETGTRDSFSPINALIESCVKYSQASVPPLDVGDDVGMNLLASVAAGEISKSDLTSPSGSPRTSPAVEAPFSGNNEVRSRLSCDEDVTQSHVHPDEVADADSAIQGKAVGSILSKDESIRDGTKVMGKDKLTMIFQDEKLFSEQIEHLSVSSESPRKTAIFCRKSEGNYEDEMDGSLPLSKSPKVEENGASEADVKQMKNKNGFENSLDCKPSTLVNNENNPIICPGEKAGDENVCTSEIPHSKVNDAHEAVVGADIMSNKLLVEEFPSLTTKEVLGGPCSADQRSVVPLVLEKNDATEAWESETCKSENLEKFQMEEVDIGKNQQLTSLSTSAQLTSLSTSAIDELARAAVSSTIAIVDIDHIQENTAIGMCQTGLERQKPCSGSVDQRGEHHSKPYMVSGTNVDLTEEILTSTDSVIGEPDASAKLDFDLNEGILADDGNQGEPATSAPTMPTPVFLPSLPPFVNSASNSLSAPITVVAPAKGPFFPLENLQKSKGEHGWKGSAATSAFRPAEPRKVLDTVSNEPDVPVDATVKPGRFPLDIDLNVVDDEVLEESQNAAHTKCFESKIVPNRDTSTKVFSGLDLDLNQVDGGLENGQLVNTNYKPGAPLLPVKLASAGFPNGEANVLRDFDLNNGPSLGDVCTEQVPRSQPPKSSNSASFLPAVAGIRMNNLELGGIPTWFPPGTSYPPVAIPSFLPDRGEQPFPIVAAPGAPRILGPVTGIGTFGGDIYRGPVLSPSPAMAFSPATAFPYAGFPFGSNFPIASTSFSGVSTSNVDSSSGSGLGFAAIPSQFVGHAGSVSSHYPRPFVINIPEGSSSVGSDNNRKWGRQNLDLNAGPGSGDIEGKDERPSLVTRQLAVSTSQAFPEEHAKLYGVPGASLKRKEPEGSWDAERSAYKQLSWQ